MATTENEPGWIDAEAAAKVDEANATARKYGLRAPKVSGERLKGGQTVKEIKLWTGKTGWLLGNFRRVFGTAFTSVANVYVRIRDKVRDLLSPRSDKGKSFGGGFPGAALKAAYAVVKGAAANRLEDRRAPEGVAGRRDEGEAQGADRRGPRRAGRGRAQGGRRDRQAPRVRFVEKLESLVSGVVDKYRAIVRESSTSRTSSATRSTSSTR